MDGLGDKKGTRGQPPCDAGRPCNEHAAIGGGGGATEPQLTVVTSQTPTFCEWKEVELKGDKGERNVGLLVQTVGIFGCSGIVNWSGSAMMVSVESKH